MTQPTDKPVRLTADEVQQRIDRVRTFLPSTSTSVGYSANNYLTDLKIHIAALEAELVEARKVVETIRPQIWNRCNCDGIGACSWCDIRTAVRAYDAAVAAREGK